MKVKEHIEIIIVKEYDYKDNINRKYDHMRFMCEEFGFDVRTYNTENQGSIYEKILSVENVDALEKYKQDSLTLKAIELTEKKGLEPYICEGGKWRIGKGEHAGALVVDWYMRYKEGEKR